MLDTTALVRSIASPPALSPDTPIVSDNLPVINPQFFQDSEDLTDEDEHLDDLLTQWDELDMRDDTVD